MKTCLWAMATVLLFGCSPFGPSRNPKLVGKWQLKHSKNSTYEFRADGTYVSDHLEVKYRTDSNVRFRSQGTWRGGYDKLYFKADKVTAANIKTTRQLFEEHRRAVLGIERPMPIRWNEKGEWGPTEVGIGTFIRVNPQ